jgi:uncharacterized protein
MYEMERAIKLSDLRRFAVARSLFRPTTLPRALERMRFVQADPIRAPARAQDLILRHRVKGYRAGDLERNYVSLDIEEDTFVNYGFVTRELQALMHPRPDVRVPAAGMAAWPAAEQKKAELLLKFVKLRGEVHPREVEEHFAHGRVRNYWGGSSHATTQLLEALQYRGLVRVARRENGIRIYRTHQQKPTRGAASAALSGSSVQARMDALVDAVLNIYGPLPAASLSFYIRRLRYAVPQWRNEIPAALQRARQRLAHAHIQGVDWYWPEAEDPRRIATATPARTSSIGTWDLGFGARDAVRLLAPFDPVVHDRARFELLWGWTYRFEAYTPPSKRKLGYYALPLLWRDRVVGWANLAVKRGELLADFAYVSGQRPKTAAFQRELEAELNRMRSFLLSTKQSPTAAL